jgi:hypothetical protein
MYKIAVLSFGKLSIEFLKVDEIMDKILLPSGRKGKKAWQDKKNSISVDEGVTVKEAICSSAFGSTRTESDSYRAIETSQKV